MLGVSERAARHYGTLTRDSQEDYVLERLPWYVSRFLGHRSLTAPKFEPPKWTRPLSVLLVTFATLVTNMAIFKFGYPFKQWGAPEILPSFGATAILLFNAVSAPLAQPRQYLVGTFFCALIGLCIEKLFMTTSGNEEHLWLSGALSVAVASTFMELTGTTHPPAGAAALLPSVDDGVRRMGWKYLVLVLASMAIFMAFALAFDNVVLRYPYFWWKPKALRAKGNEKTQLIQEEKRQILITPEEFTTPDNVQLDDVMLDMIRVLQQEL